MKELTNNTGFAKMSNCEQELEQLRAYQQVLQDRLRNVETELSRLFALTHDDRATLGCVRILLEALLKELHRDLNLPLSDSMMVGAMLDQLRAKANNIVPRIVPQDIYLSMSHINALSTPGAHDKPYDPKQVREALVALERILHWYVVTYKGWSLPDHPVVADNLQAVCDLSRLPPPATALIGRTNELQLLQQAFITPPIFLAIIVAAGGIGKSALTDAWLKQIRPHYHGVQRVLAWSFYSQGSHNTQTSSAPFFQKALPFFGWAGELPKEDVAKGRELAKLLVKQSFLLILDGLEPLQHPTQILDGELKDTALKALFEEVRLYGLAQSPSLLVISSRQPLVELQAWETKHYVTLDLQTLPVADGVTLLKQLGAQGLDAELAQASEEMGGHALALVLLGKLLKTKFAGRIERRDQLPPLWEERQHGGHALRVLQFYAERYWQADTPELAFLQLLGLLDRPLDLREKEVLVTKADCAQPLRALDDVGWELLERHLEEAGLLNHPQPPMPLS